MRSYIHEWLHTHIDIHELIKTATHKHIHTNTVAYIPRMYPYKYLYNYKCKKHYISGR